MPNIKLQVAEFTMTGLHELCECTLEANIVHRNFHPKELPFQNVPFKIH
jgi:hypothetical protein